MTRLRILREERGESIADLARILNAPPGTVGKWDRDEREMDYSTLIAVSDHFGVSVDYLLGRDRDLDTLRPDEKDLLSIYRSLPSAHKTLLIKISQMMAEHNQEK